MQNNKITFQIQITKEYKLKCSIIEQQGKETYIKITEEDQTQEYYPTIQFNNNFISFCKNDHNNETIHFIQKWFENPEDYSTYHIQFQNKNYELLPEALFALIINEFKNKIEKDFIIENTLLELQTQNNKTKERIEISLEALNLKGMKIKEKELEYDYSKQGEYLEEIIEKKETFERMKRMIEKSKSLTETKEEKEKLEQIDLNSKDIRNEEELNNEIVKRFKTKDRTRLQMTRLDNYCLFITSRYFNSLEDHLNFTQVSKKLKYNMEKFYYNPISINENNQQLFPNIETLHVYSQNDKYLTGGRIQFYVDWFKRVPYHQIESIKKENEGKDIKFKNIIWTAKDTEIQINDQFEQVLQFPSIVKEIEKDSLIKFSCNINKIIIPESVKIIPKECMRKMRTCTSITIPLNYSHMIIGNKIFTTKNGHFDLYIYSENWIKEINDKKVERLTSLTIPTSITSFDETCFPNSFSLEQLVIPESIKSIPFKSFAKMMWLEDLTVPSHYKLHGNKLFYENDNCLHSIDLPTTLKRLNGKEFKCKPLETFTIPSNITKLSDYCFTNCNQLSEIKGLENVKEIGFGCFINCDKLDRNKYPIVENKNKEYLNETVKEKHQKQLEEWTLLKCSDIIFDSKINSWSVNSSEFIQQILGKSKLMFIIEDERNEIFGYYLNTEVIYQYEKHLEQFKKIETDSYSFHFNLQSNNNRLENPMKFEIKNLRDTGHRIYEDSSDFLIELGEITLRKEFDKMNCRCEQHEDLFNYHGIEKALCGKEPFRYGIMTFTPKRILIIQMK